MGTEKGTAMGKFSAIGLVGIMALLLAACGAPEEEGDWLEPTPAAETPAATENPIVGEEGAGPAPQAGEPSPEAQESPLAPDVVDTPVPTPTDTAVDGLPESSPEVENTEGARSPSGSTPSENAEPSVVVADPDDLIATIAPTATATSIPVQPVPTEPVVPTVVPTATMVPPTATAVPPTATVPLPTATVPPPTATPTQVPPTATPTPTEVPALVRQAEADPFTISIDCQKPSLEDIAEIRSRQTGGSGWNVAYEVGDYISISVIQDTRVEDFIGTWRRNEDGGWFSVPTTRATEVTDWPRLVWDPHPHEWNRFPGLDSRVCFTGKRPDDSPRGRYTFNIPCRPVSVMTLEEIARQWRDDQGGPWQYANGEPWLHSVAYEVGGYVSVRTESPYYENQATWERGNGGNWYAVTGTTADDRTTWPTKHIDRYIWSREQGPPPGRQWNPLPGLYSRMCVLVDQNYPWR